MRRSYLPCSNANSGFHGDGFYDGSKRNKMTPEGFYLLGYSIDSIKEPGCYDMNARSTVVYSTN